MHRLFVALRPPPPIRHLMMTIMHGVAAARWQDDDQLHLTVRYIGDVERPTAEDLATALAAIRHPPIEARLAGVGHFAHKGRTDTLWAAPAPPEPLATFHHKVDRALVRIGLPPASRAYRPHLTLARLTRSDGTGPDIGQWLAAHAGLASAPFIFDQFILYESHRDRDRARYEPVGRWPLRD